MTKYLKARINGKQIFIKKDDEIGSWLQEKKRNSEEKQSYEQILTKLYKKSKLNSFDEATLAYSIFETTILHLYSDRHDLEDLLIYLRPVILQKIKKKELSDDFLNNLIDFLK